MLVGGPGVWEVEDEHSLNHLFCSHNKNLYWLVLASVAVDQCFALTLVFLSPFPFLSQTQKSFFKKNLHCLFGLAL